MSLRHAMAVFLALGFLIDMARAGNNGIDSRASPYSVTQTMERLKAVLQTKGIRIFARINHSGEAQRVGLSLRHQELLIFGNPQAGTPLMQAVPTIGLDLPLKALVWQDNNGQVWVSWNKPDYLIQRYALDTSYVKNLSPISGLIDAALK